MTAPGRALEHMRAVAPLVQNITNYVAMNPMANILLAAGASPAMVHAREEAAEFAAIADALTINIGTLSAAWLESMVEAAAAANAAAKPWVLDPVAVGATAFRRFAGERLLALGPTLIRGNASEIIALAHRVDSGKGVDSADAVSAAESAATELARATGAVVAVTGPVDFVTDGTRAARIANGDALMPRVTALGCALTGVAGAFLGAGCERFDGTVAALAYYGLAGEIAAAEAAGPGSFAVRFLDALAGIGPDDLDAGSRIEGLAG
jgi:hydroxyethylthiazole kinase